MRLSAQTRNVGLALVCLLCLGAGHRWVRASRADLANVFTPPSRALVELPARIGPYRATGDVPLGQDLLRASAVDTFVNRAYIDPDSGDGFQLYIGYWGKENTGTGHGPDICYPATGWHTEATRTAEIRFGDSVPESHRNAEFDIYRFTKTEPQGTKHHLVGFATITNERIAASSRDLFWHKPASRDVGRFLTHVQVVSVVEGGNWQQAESSVEAFLATVIPTIVDFLPRSETSVHMGE